MHGGYAGSGVGTGRPPHTPPPSFAHSHRPDILAPGTATPHHGHHQPGNLPHVIVGGVHVDLLRRWYMYVDLLRGTSVPVASFGANAGPLSEAGLWFWLGVMAVFDNAEDSEYYNVTLELRILCFVTLPPSPPTAALRSTALRPALHRAVPVGQLC